MLRILLLSGEELTSVSLTEVSDVKELKQRLHRQHDLPPRFRQRLVHQRTILGDAVELDTIIASQVVATTTTEEPERERSAVKRRRIRKKRPLDPEGGLPPQCNERLLNDSSKPTFVMDLQVLIPAFVDASEHRQRQLMTAVAFGHVIQVEAAASHGPECCRQHVDGCTRKPFASGKGNLHVAKLLLEARADVNSADDVGTALTSAAFGGHAPVARWLLEAGAQKDLRNSWGQTALLEAVTKPVTQDGDAQVVQLLVKSHCQLNLRNCCGRTALMVAASQGHAGNVHILLDGGAQRDLRANDGCTALMFAAIISHDPGTELLLKGGARIDLQNNAGQTALTLATDVSVFYSIQNEDFRRFCEKMRSDAQIFWKKRWSNPRKLWKT